MEDAWWDNKVDEIQHLANTGDTRGFFQAIKTIYGPQGASTTPILATDGTTVLSEGSEILGRWKTHFDQLLNQRSEANPDVLNRIPQRPILQNADPPIRLEEVELAVKSLSANKAPGMDGIPAEVFQKGGTEVMKV